MTNQTVTLLAVTSARLRREEIIVNVRAGGGCRGSARVCG